MGKSHDTHRARGAGAHQLHGVCHGSFRAGRSGHEPCAAHTADREHDNHHMSGQLRHAGNELPEFLHSDHRGGGDKSCGVNEYRRLQSQLHDPAACLQTAVLKEASRDDEKLARLQRRFTRRSDPRRQSSFGAAALEPTCRLIWRPRPELNRGTRFCRPLRNHSATWPCAAPSSRNSHSPALRQCRLYRGASPAGQPFAAKTLPHSKTPFIPAKAGIQGRRPGSPQLGPRDA